MCAETIREIHIIISHASAQVRYGEMWMEEKDEKERNDGNYNRTKMAGRKRQEDEQKESKKKSRKEQQKKKATRKKKLEKSKRI